MIQDKIIKLIEYIECEIKKLEYEKLIESIKSNKDLLYLFDDDKNIYYKISDREMSKCMTHLHKCVIKTKEYPFLCEYIDMYLQRNLEELDKQNDYGCSALMLACINSNNLSNDETVDILLKYKPNLEIKDKHGHTALMYASGKSNTISSNTTVKKLIEAGSDVNAQENRGSTPLLISCIMSKSRDSNAKTIEMLLEAGSNPMIHSNSRFAFEEILNLDEDHPELIKLFFDHGFKLEKLEHFHNAIPSKKFESLKIMLLNCNDFNIKIGKHKMIRLLSMLDNGEELVKIAISRGANKEDLLTDKERKLFEIYSKLEN